MQKELITLLKQVSHMWAICFDEVCLVQLKAEDGKCLLCHSISKQLRYPIFSVTDSALTWSVNH